MCEGACDALDAAAAGLPPGRELAQQAALRGKRVAVLPAAAYGGHKDASAAWAAGVLTVGAGPAAAGQEGAERKFKSPFAPPARERAPQRPRRRPPLARGDCRASSAVRQPRRSARAPGGARPVQAAQERVE